MANKIPQKVIINRFKEIHGSKYRYSRVEYEGALIKIKIWCSSCKEYFYQQPTEHLRGRGCNKCGNIKAGKLHRITKKDFVKKARKLHGFRYYYFAVKYTRNRNKIKIYCRQCKEYFWQLPSNHLSGRGCKTCQIKKATYTVDIFEEKARQVHNNKYTYHQNYINSKIKVKITCPIHGDFWKTPNSHLSGQGCTYCSEKNYDYIIFERKASNQHKNKYIYPQDYINSKIKVKITCPIHGDFKQIPSAHLRGNGCFRCRGTNTQNEIYDLVSKITKLKFEYNIYLPELHGLELDIYNSRKKLAIEYNGEGHYLRYENGFGFLTKERIKSQQKRDSKKKRLCRKHNINLVILPCYEWNKLKTPTEKRQYLTEKIE